MKRILLWSFLCALGLAACRAERNAPLPTQADPAALGTQVILTQQAPPAGFAQVSYPAIDDGLEGIAGWRYEASLSFEGVFASTTRRAAAKTTLAVQDNLVLSARRILAEVDNDLQAASDRVNYEAVRLGDDAFLLRDGACLTDDEAAQTVSGLGAGALLGGISLAQADGQQATLNGFRVWRYTITPETLLLPNIAFNQASRLLALTGELWVAPELPAVVRYYVNLEVENVTLFGETLPVTGTILLRYDLLEAGAEYNISVPFGC